MWTISFNKSEHLFFSGSLHTSGPSTTGRWWASPGRPTASRVGTIASTPPCGASTQTWRGSWAGWWKRKTTSSPRWPRSWLGRILRVADENGSSWTRGSVTRGEAPRRPPGHQGYCHLPPIPRASGQDVKVSLIVAKYFKIVYFLRCL